MGILNALGLMTKADFDEYVTETAAIARRNAELAKENGLLVSQRDMLTTKFNSAAKDLAKQSDEIAALKTSADLDNDTILGLRSQLEAAEQIIARLKPLAEATERRRANDAKRVRPSRAKKAATDTVKTGAATGKPRTAIPAKVGGGSAKLSGDRPAKKASGK